MPESRQTIRIFIASSSDVATEREKMVVLLSDINKHFPHLYLEPVKWETDFESGSYGERVQDKINPLLDTSDIVIFLFFSRAGIFTLEEFERARKQCKKAFYYFKPGFSSFDEDKLKQFNQVVQLRAALEKENKGLYEDFSTIAELENHLRKDLGFYLADKYPKPAGLPAAPPLPEPEPLAEWPLPDDIGYPEHPFIGFERFREQDAHIFFGRNNEIKEILELLENQPNKILLLYGQSGAGKSSLLEAGLLPRLRHRGWAVEMRRRDPGKGLIHDLNTGRQILRSKPAGPKLLLLDQAEEMITNPNPDISNEMNTWGDALAGAWREGFGSTLLLSFRKEYVGEFLDLLQKRRDLPCEPIFLHPLTHQGVRYAVAGDKGRQAQYDLAIPSSLPALMANDLSPVTDSRNLSEPGQSAPHTAPLLQITLRKMWDQACAGQKKPRISFDDKLYRRVQRSNLDEMLSQQLIELEHYFSPDEHDPEPSIGRKPLPELHRAIRNGLALDVLRQFVTAELTATGRSLEFLEKECYSHVPHFRDLITALKSLFLLTEEPGAVNHNTRLAHDALAPLVHQRCSASQLPAQLAWSLVELKNRHAADAEEADFSDADVRTVEAGEPYMQCIPEAVKNRLNASKAALERQRAELRDKTALIFDTLAGDALANIAAVEHVQALEKFKAAMAVDVPAEIRQEKLEPALLELAFFLSATGQHEEQTLECLQLLPEFPRPETAAKALEHALKHRKTGRKQLHDLVQTLAPDGAFRELRDRYYPAMLPVKSGSFRMGSTDGYKDEQPPHKISLKDYLMGATPVTFYQFGLYCAATGRSIAASAPPWGKTGTHPVVLVMWYDAVEYFNWLSEQFGFTPACKVDKTQKDPNNSSSDIFKWLVEPVAGADGFRLPTEAEWEFAARGGIPGTKDPSAITKYAGSDDLDAVGWYWKNSGDKLLDGKWDYEQVLRNNGRTHPCGLKKPNQLGLCDMSGNVYEWCWDWYGEEYYKSSPEKNPAGPDAGSNRVLRGGAWDGDADCCRVAFRHFDGPGFRVSFVGFRPARTVSL
ncbi:MAG: Hercynine oxygenase [Saprospiraceae bacterium]|nr:Hercynine oxygenase [Saprospiraceae bacterium]